MVSQNSVSFAWKNRLNRQKGSEEAKGRRTEAMQGAGTVHTLCRAATRVGLELAARCTHMLTMGWVSDTHDVPSRLGFSGKSLSKKPGVQRHEDRFWCAA